MAFLKAKPDAALGRKNISGMVYILIMIVDGNEVFKIGVTSRNKVEDRVIEILTSHYKSYRFFCYCYPKRFRKTSDIYEKEKILHDYFKACKYSSEQKFQGCQELFLVEDIDVLLDVYERVIDGEVVEGTYSTTGLDKVLNDKSKETTSRISDTTGEAI